MINKNKCRVCHSANTKKYFIANNYHGHYLYGKEKFQIYKCLNCHSLFIANININNSYFKKYYPNSYTLKPGIIDKIYSYLNNIKFNQYFRKYKKVSILDIGCGNCQFLNSLSNKFKKYGTDIKKQSNNVNIFIGDFNKIEINKKFDCITMFHVLEHMSNPKGTILKAKTLLNKNGKIFITTPNANALGLRLGKKYFFHLDTPRHLFIPSINSIKNLLIQSGFSNIKCSYTFHDFPLDLFWSTRFSPWKYIIYPLYPIFKIFAPETILFTASFRSAAKNQAPAHNQD